ncbi:MAG: class I SAM-dependent methyltransferase [Lentisphaerae bacterium]|nr:class I SAM-dependent methyltransferase [Lentisphaerota bacterium]MCP4103767.1 class I SAM-dependent methyltransferase [Lentisphaerota bacterium]
MKNFVNRIYDKLYTSFYSFRDKYELKTSNAEDLFTYIYRHNRWHSKESVSGAGSGAEQSEVLVKALPAIINKYNISSIYDVPCGDFNWMKEINLSGIDYLGADIVKELITLNCSKYSSINIDFKHINLLSKDAFINLPKKSSILCRDCLVHFSYKNIFTALENFCLSDSKYLITTTFPKTKKNIDIITGLWRPINLTLHPFNLPEPIEAIDEENTEFEEEKYCKHLALWLLDDVREKIKTSRYIMI